jgi:hypothetical protein
MYMATQNQNDVQRQNHMYLSCGGMYFFGAVILERGLRLTKFMGCFWVLNLHREHARNMYKGDSVCARARIHTQ